MLQHARTPSTSETHAGWSRRPATSDCCTFLLWTKKSHFLNGCSQINFPSITSIPPRMEDLEGVANSLLVGVLVGSPISECWGSMRPPGHAHYASSKYFRNLQPTRAATISFGRRYKPFEAEQRTSIQTYTPQHVPGAPPSPSAALMADFEEYGARLRSRHHLHGHHIAGCG